MNLKNVGAEIPPDKLKLFKILIDKDYDEHPLKEDTRKKGVGFLRSIL